MKSCSGPRISGCGKTSRVSGPSTLQGICAEYLRDHWPCARKEVEWFGKRRGSLADAIRCAARSELPSDHSRGMGRLVVHSHQRRQGRRRLAHLADLLAIEEQAIEAAKSFPLLIGIVDTVAKQIEGIGPLTCYDVAHRIGCYKGIAPDAVYLHAGTLVGARALGLAKRANKVATSMLPRPLNRLSATQAEDVLCIYKTQLKEIARRSQPRR